MKWVGLSILALGAWTSAAIAGAMKPTLRALLTLLERHRGEWINHATVYEAGGHRTTARVMELRQTGYTVEQEGVGENSRYRLVSSPPIVPAYARYSCLCGYSGPEPMFTHFFAEILCPKCGKLVAGKQELIYVR